MTPPEPTPAPTPKPDPMVAWSKVQQYADKLFDAIEALDEAGGIRAAVEAGGWTPKARKRADASLEAAREAIARQLAQLRGGGMGRA